MSTISREIREPTKVIHRGEEKVIQPMERLTQQELADVAKYLVERAFAKGQEDLDFGHLELFLNFFVYTMDEHDSANPFKRLPLNTKPYLIRVAREWFENPLVVVAKSRQTMLTWIISACFLWDAMFRKARLNIVVSKKSDDANEVLNRIKGIYMRMPLSDFWHSHMPVKKSPGNECGSYCLMEFVHNKSRIMGLSQNPDDIKGLTASNIFSDEVAAQERARETFVAMKPTLDGGGRYVAVSTPLGRNYFYEMVHKPDNGFKKVFVHYSEDLLKDDEWLKIAKAGLSDDEWQQEQEINFSRAGGEVMYPSFSKQIHVKELQAVRGRKLICGIDFGFRHPALVITQMTDKDQLAVLQEYMPSDIEVVEFGKRCLYILKKEYPWHFERREHYVDWYCDPAGNQRNDKSSKTSVQLLREKLGIFCRYKQTKIMEGVTLIRELLKRRSDMSPGILFDPKCRILIEGFEGGYEQVKARSSGEIDERPRKDGFFEHTQDALREIVVNKFNRFMRPYNPNLPRGDYFDPLELDDIEEETKQSSVTGYSL